MVVQTIRFTKIVGEIGPPEPYTLWLPPEQDRHFQSAIKAHRVMTVHQENSGHGSDFGEVGFVRGAQGSYLLFPGSLKRYEGRRVVGVKYDLLKEPPAEAPAPAPKKSTKREPAKKPAPLPDPAPPPPKAAPPPKFEPLRVMEPPEVKKQPAAPAAQRDEASRLAALTREVRRAMKKLEQGNAVGAYQILEKCVTPR